MIFKCSKCGRKITYLDKDAKFCPYCGSEIETADATKSVATLYNEGRTPKEISAELGIRLVSVEQALAKAAARGMVPTDGIVQDEYEKALNALMDDKWNGKLKSLKEGLPSDCTYITIEYYAEKNKMKKNEENQERLGAIRDMICQGVSAREISDKTRSSIYMVERLIIEEAKADENVMRLYISPEHEKKILDFIRSDEYDGKIKPIHERYPDIDYVEIKAVKARHDIE